MENLNTNETPGGPDARHCVPRLVLLKPSEVQLLVGHYERLAGECEEQAALFPDAQDSMLIAAGVYQTRANEIRKEQNRD